MSTTDSSATNPPKVSKEFLNKVTIAKRKLLSAAKEIKQINDQGRLAVALNGVLERPKFFGMYLNLNRCYERLEGQWDDLHEAYVLEDLASNFPSEKENEIYETAKRYFYEANTNYTSLATKQLEASTLLNTTTTNITEQKRPITYLPKITLPTFSGELVEWPRFRDTFLSLVHNEDNLSGLEKFHYLSSSLTGPAYAVIQHLPLLESNYLLAWAALNKAFDNKRLLASNYLDKLVNFRPLQGRPTKESLRLFLSQINDNINAFKQLAIPQESSFVLFHLAVRCLDSKTREAFELAHVTEDYPTLDTLMTFVMQRCQAMEMSSQSDAKSPCLPNQKPRTALLSSAGDKGKDTPVMTTAQLPSSGVNPQLTCHLCSQGHSLQMCDAFRKLDPQARLQRLSSWRGCKNCLAYSHQTSQCSSTRSCMICRSRHHTWLHLDRTIITKPTSSQQDTPPQAPVEGAPVKTLLAGPGCQEVLLGTALAEIEDIKGNWQVIRIVLDCGSQYSFITSACALRLGLAPVGCDIPVSGIGQVKMTSVKGMADCTLRATNCPTPKFSTVAIVIDTITHNIPQAPFSAHSQCLKAFKLADPTFCTPRPVDFLLGADLFFDIITGTPISVASNIPKLVPTFFGHVVAGKSLSGRVPANATSLLANSGTETLSQLVSRFWTIEEVAPRTVLSQEERQCETHFVNHHARLPSGRYSVSLPFKESTPSIVDSRHQALLRFLNLERKLDRIPDLGVEYRRFMSDYLTLGHMERTNTPSKYIIPHHGVYKGEGQDAKLRVVFDASGKNTSTAINSCLLPGPKLQLEIADLLLNFRIHEVVLVADIVKMFRQILINQPDRKYQHIFWRFDSNDPIQEYELTTLTYGMTSSPYLAIRVLHQLVADEGHYFPDASKALLKDIYVDDILTGASSVEKALLLQRELITLLGKGCFRLSKWASNKQEILDSVDASHDNSTVDLTSDDDQSIKILGLHWDPKLDAFIYKVRPPLTSMATKRTILSTIARIYDPLGYLSPTIFFAKHIFQQTWLAALEWDQQVPIDIGRHWNRFTSELEDLSELVIPRHISVSMSSDKILLGFCDASLKGYAACIYLRISTESSVNIFLLKAKTKLAPTKPMTVPRLELCAALLLSRLYQSIVPFIQKLAVVKHFWFSDSTDVIGWAKTDPNKLKPFVAHRVIEIAENLGTVRWHHITTASNPADCASRGITPSELTNHSLWWSGPEWMKHEENEWPLSTLGTRLEELPEIKPTVMPTALITQDTYTDVLTTWIERFSSFPKLLRTYSYIRRYLLRLQKQQVSGPIKQAEIADAEMALIKHTQRRFFSHTSSKNELDPAIISKFNAFVDQVGVVRVGGRLRNAPLPDNTKYPILLPSDSHLVKIMIDHYHRIYLHLGHSALQYFMQGRYWITPSIRNLIRSRIFKCLRCYKASHIPHAPYMGNLPLSRFAEGKAFVHTGVDYAGPFIIKESNRRKSPTSKAYLCLFICMSTKAIHLELVSNCTTEAFLATLDRFIARRGKPVHIYSDCGPTFVGANNQMKELYKLLQSNNTQDSIMQHCTTSSISWSFNPPYAPHFGGLWEAGVKSVKSVFRKVLESTPFTFEELSTLFCRIEAVLNSRPLCPLYADDQTYECLTPGHFLTGAPLIARPEQFLIDVKINRLSRWELVQQRLQHYWKRWRTEYLQTLQQRTKWLQQRPQISVGDLVIMDDPNADPTHWPMARVTDIYPGTDGVVRVVGIRTATATYKRPITKVVPLLPINQSPEVNQQSSSPPTH